MELSTPGTRRGMLLVMLASTLWGTSGAASQLVAQMGGSSPLSLAFLRLFFAAPVLLIVGQIMYGRQMWAASRRDFALMMLHGSLVGLAQAMYFTAISFAGIAVATLITICAAPILVNLLTALTVRRRPDNFLLILVGMALVGTVLLVGGSQSHASEPVSLVGVILSLGAAFGTALVILLGRFLAGRCQPLQVTAIGFTTGAVLLGFIAGAAGFVGNYPAAGWLLIVYLGVVPTALAYSLFIVGMRATPAPIASVLVLLEPLTATVIAWLLFGERFDAAGIVGAVLLLAAIFLLARRE